LVTPIPAAIARPLIEGLRNESTVHDPIARQLFPKIQPVVNPRVSMYHRFAATPRQRFTATMYHL
jgi:hypothetical protein